MVDGQYATPLLLKTDRESVPLRRVPFAAGHKGFNYDEQWLQQLLFSHPQSLPITEIDASYQQLVPICTELNTPAGPIDVLFATPEGKLVLLEAKLWRNPEARRKVIGQILDYAKELNHWDYEELQKQVSRRRAEHGNSLYQAVKACYPETQEAAFVDEVSRSLRTGKFMLLIVGDGIREGAGAIAQFLEDVGHLQFSLGLVEVGVYETPSQEVLIQPRVLAKTVIIHRTVVELTSPELRVRSAEETREVDDKEEDTFYREFWSELLQNLTLDDVTQPLPRQAKAQSLWLTLPPGGTNAWINAYFAGSQGEVGVYFRLAKNDFGEMAYEELEKEKDKILSELPSGVQWGMTRGFRTVSATLPVPDIRDPARREEIKTFFETHLNAFVNAFRSRMEDISKRILTD